MWSSLNVRMSGHMLQAWLGSVHSTANSVSICTMHSTSKVASHVHGKHAASLFPPTGLLFHTKSCRPSSADNWFVPCMFTLHTYVVMTLQGSSYHCLKTLSCTITTFIGCKTGPDFETYAETRRFCTAAIAFAWAVEMIDGMSSSMKLAITCQQEC